MELRNEKPPMMKATTIKDIAAHVGVSNTTVSAVLGQNPSAHVRVSEDTRQRILEAARLLRYRPNGLARSLRYQKTNVIGVYTAYGYLHPQGAFTAQIIGGMREGCDELNKDLLLHGSTRNRHADEIYAELADGRVDGLILYTAPHDPLVEQLAHSTLPVVAIVDALPGLPSVVADDAGGTRLLVEHLARQGHRRIFHRSHLLPIVSVERRHQAMQEAAEEFGLSVTDCSTALHHENLTEAEVAWLSLPREEPPDPPGVPPRPWSATSPAAWPNSSPRRRTCASFAAGPGWWRTRRTAAL